MSCAFHMRLDPAWIPGANSCPLPGQVWKSPLSFHHGQLKGTAQGHLQTQHIKHLLTRYLHSQLGNGRSFTLCLLSKNNTTQKKAAECRSSVPDWWHKVAESQAMRRESHGALSFITFSASETALMFSQQGIASLSFSLCWSFSRNIGCFCWIFT